MSHGRHTIETDETSDSRIISLKTTSLPWIAKKAYQKFSDLENIYTLHSRFNICGCQSSQLYKRLCPSVSPSVSRSVYSLVNWSVCGVGVGVDGGTSPWPPVRNNILTPTSIISFFILFFIKRDRASLWGNMSVHLSISPYLHWYFMSERIYGPSLT